MEPRASESNPPLRPGEVAAYYDEKTARLVDKYAIGYRLHYHTGISDGEYPAEAGTERLRELMHESQVRALDIVADGIRRFAKLPSDRAPDLLDLGCGLGGGSIYWVENLGAKVRAYTIAPEHVPLIARFAQEAGLGDRIDARVQDGNALTGEDEFDLVVGFESICHMDRHRVFPGVTRLLRRGGTFHVFDWMRGEFGEGADRADAYWHTRMGTPAEHHEIARELGLELVHDEPVHQRMVGFWRIARAWNEAAMRERNPSEAERARLQRSCDEIGRLEDAFASGEVRYHHMVFRKPD